MGKSRKPLSEQTGHLTAKFQKQREFEENLVKSSRHEFEKPPAWLIDDYAVAEYKRIIKDLIRMDIIGDLDITNIAGYCNSYVLWLRATAELEEDYKKYGSLKVVSQNGVKVENPLINVQRKYAQEMRDFERLCGLTIDSRLKMASTKSQEIDNIIGDKFGDI